MKSKQLFDILSVKFVFYMSKNIFYFYF